MANTYSNLFYHYVFSTKKCENFIHQDIESRVWSYLGGIARKQLNMTRNIFSDNSAVADATRNLVPPHRALKSTAKFIKSLRDYGGRKCEISGRQIKTIRALELKKRPIS